MGDKHINIYIYKDGIGVVARTCFFDGLTGIAGRSVQHIGHMFGFISQELLSFDMLIVC